MNSSQSTAASVGTSSSILDQTNVEYVDFNQALSNSTSGDVICFRAGIYSSIRIENIQGGNNGITLQAEPDSLVEIINSDYKGTGIFIRNAKNITISGFTVSGGLYGIYAKGSSDLTLINNHVFNVGQEGIMIKSAISQQPLSNFIVANNVISDTGKGLSQYGEGIYIGDGNDNFNEVLHNVTIENNHIAQVTNEAIDIKINVNTVNVLSNTIIDTDLKFNGAITVATSDRYGENSNITISSNTIRGVTNRSGYRPLAIAIGQGNALIENNIIIEDNSRFIGVCLFSTFMNPEANTVTLANNEVITNGKAFSANCGSGGTGAKSFANVIQL